MSMGFNIPTKSFFIEFKDSMLKESFPALQMLSTVKLSNLLKSVLKWDTKILILESIFKRSRGNDFIHYNG